MPKKPDERIVQAKELFDSGMKLVEIASQLDLPPGTIRRWKSTHHWDGERSDKKDANVRKKKGGQPGNHNATGPPRNQHARKHGLFAKWIPEEIREILNVSEEAEMDQLDYLWASINVQWSQIVYAQNLMFVTGKDDMTTTKISESCGNTSSETWEVQQAWDKQANFMGAQARAMKTLESMIKTYEELLSKESGSASEEQRARINQLKAQTKKLEDKDDGEIDDDGFMDAITGIVSQMQMPKEEDL